MKEDLSRTEKIPCGCWWEERKKSQVLKRAVESGLFM